MLWAFLPPGHVGFLSFLGAFLGAQVLGLASHVPGGLGVFETALVVLCKPSLSASDLLPALIVYRAVYYLLPFAVAVATLVADEFWQRRHAAAGLRSLFGAAAREITPRLLAVFVFLAGALLLGGVAALAGTTSGPPVSVGGSNASSSNSMYCPASSPAAGQPKKQPGGNRCGQP